MSILLSLFWLNAFSQGPDWCWADDPIANGNEEFLDVSTDPVASISYAVGYFNDDLSASFPTGVNNTPDMSTTIGNQDGLVVKYDSNGVPLWAFKIGNSGDRVWITGVEVVSGGDFIITGYFDDNCNFAGVTGSPNTFLSASSKDPFIASYDSDGNLNWVVQGQNSGEGIANDIAVNSTHVFGIGWFESSLTWTGGTAITSNDLLDTYTVAYEISTGTFAWVTKAGDIDASNENDMGYSIAADDDDVYITGTHSGTIEFGGGPLQVTAPTGGTRNIYLAELNATTGAPVWANNIGGTNGCEAHGLAIDANNLYVVGGVEGSVDFPGVPTEVVTGSQEELFICAIDRNTQITQWLDIAENDNGTEVFGEDIVLDNLGSVYWTGSMRGTTQFGYGADPLTSIGGDDVFVSAYKDDGVYLWTKVGTDGSDIFGRGLGYDNYGSVIVAGMMNNEATFSPLPILPDAGGDDAFIAKLNCTSGCSGPSITTCPADLSVNADPTCNYTLGDFIPSTIANDDCSTGALTITQSPVAGTVLSAGQHTITMTATDGNSNTATCSFEITVEATVNPTIVSCGDVFTGVTTSTDDNTQDTWTCSGVSTPGQDIYYQITVPTGNYLLGVTMDNVADANDTQIETFWMGAGCPTTTTCIEHNVFNIGSQTFTSSGQNQLLFNAAGPGTYWFVVDSRSIDGVDAFDIEFDCIVSGVEFDESSNCGGNDPDGDGLNPSINGTATLDVEPCEVVTLCQDVFVQNVQGGEWLDTVVMTLGPCYTNVTNITPTAPGPNGFYDGAGTWNAIYDGPTNSIEWGFDYSGPQLWGDGTGTNYNCRTYSFCFDAEIAPGCSTNSDLEIEIYIEDDGVDGFIPGASAGFDYATQDDINLIIPPTPTLNYASTTYCTTGADPTPTATPAGGTFTAPPGLAINNGDGEIDLSNTTPGTYLVTYTDPSACANTATFTVTVDGPLDPAFSYTAANFCESDTDPTPTVTTPGGQFTSTAGLVFTDGSPSSTGEIDLSASVGGPYTITYVTNNNCGVSSSQVVTVDDDITPTLNYTPTAYCTNGTDPTPTATPAGGTFTAPAGLAINNGDGEIDLSNTTPGTYTVTYTEPSACANTATFTVTVDDASSPPVPDLISLPNLTDECSVPTPTAPTATDNCDGPVTGTTTTTFPITTQGTTVITWTYTDLNGNSSTQTQNVIIDDVTAPVADNASLPNITDECSVAAPTAPTATDNCDGTVTGTTTTTFPITTQGTTVITWTYTDTEGNSSTQTQNVIIDDVTAPVADISNLPNVTTECSASPTAPTATDNCDGTVTGTTTTTFPITTQGTTVITWTYTDAEGNSSTQTQNVIIDDVTAPVADNASLPNITDECSLAAPTAPTATDNCDGTVTGTTTTTFPITTQGTTVVTWTYTDAEGNSSTQTQNVIIDDVTAPVADNASLPNITDECSVAAPTAPSATDNCDGTVTGTTTTTFPITTQGTTVVTWTYTDAEGNSSTQTQNVIIDDVTAPVADNASLPNITDECSVAAPTAPSATDNCDGTVTGTTTTTFPITTQGTTVITWTYTDAEGNSSTQTQNVIIDDVTAPVADNASLPNITDECSVAAPTAPTATDNCDGTVTGTTTTTFPITIQGTTTITWTYSDSEGNSSTQTQNVIINDTTSPNLTCPIDTTVYVPSNSCEIEFLELSEPVFSDNCGLVTLTCDSVTNYAPGNYIINWTATDPQLNDSVCQQTVTVLDTISPVISCPLDTTVCDPIANYNLATATDNCSVSTIVQFAGPSNGNPLNFGTNLIEFYAEDLSGNRDSCSFIITYNGIQDPYFEIDSINCEANGNFSPTNIVTNGGVFNDDGTGLIFTDNLTGEIDVTSTTPGSYSIEYVTQGVCPDSLLYEIVIQPDVDSTWGGVDSLCFGSPVLDLTSLVSGTTGGSFSGVGVSSNNFNPSLSGSGTFSLTYTVGSFGCEESLSQDMVVLDDPIAYAGEDDEICGDQYPLNGTITNGTGLWYGTSVSFSGGGTSPSETVTSSIFGDQLIYLFVDQLGICSALDSVLITFDEQPIAYAGEDIELDYLFEVFTDADNPLVGNGVWDSGNAEINFDSPTSPITLVSNLELGDNYLTWEVTNGVCPSVQDELVITVNDLKIPQGISPDFDGKNDYWVIPGLENIPNDIEIYNRWGQVVFSQSDYDNSWYGLNNRGVELPADTYFYVITTESGRKLNGYLTLVR